jgi:hypothetical protein
MEIIMTKTANQVFLEAFDSIEGPLVPYDSKWENGTGYLDRALKEPLFRSLGPGEYARFVDDVGRKAIVIGTQLGPVIIFQRYSKSKDTEIVCNADVSITRVFGDGSLTPSQVNNYLGNPKCPKITSNVGYDIRRILEAYAEELEEQALEA